jgi:hypothetical protein
VSENIPKNVNRSPSEGKFIALPASLRGLFQKVIDGVNGALHVALIDTLVGEFHEKFNALWNTPGDRDAARALRQCDRTHRETAMKVVNEVLASQLGLLARAISDLVKNGGNGVDGGVPDDILSIIESKVVRLEEQLATFEGMVE